MIFSKNPRPESLKALADASPNPFWLEHSSKPQAAPALEKSIDTELLVVGGGYTGLWTALLAAEQNPGRDVVLIEGGESASGASGRNGGFVASSLTHGFHNGLQRWPGELNQLIALGHKNLEGIEDTIRRYEIDCDYIRSGEMTVAVEPYQVEEMRGVVDEARAHGEMTEFWDKERVQADVHSPAYLGALFDPNVGMVDPARLAWGLRRACLQRGIRIFEMTKATGLEESRAGITVSTEKGQIRAQKVALATNAFPPLLKRLSYYIVPVYDYALMTEPVTPAQRESIGWQARQGIGDAANQFHYYHMSADGRILWGGYDAIYHWNNGFGPQFETDEGAFGRLAEHFFQVFPQLDGLRFTHAWGGAIDTCSRFSAFWGSLHGGRTAYSVGFTGLGVGASRFGALVMLDLLDGKSTERTALEMVRTKPTPFPPEPLRSIGINLSRWSLDQADQNQGRRNLWLKVMDALGLGFDS